MSKQPYLPLFFGDFLAATAEWSGEEQALYLLLLGHQWSLGSLPADETKLQRLVRWERKSFRAAWGTVQEKFSESESEPGRLVNARLEEHRERAFGRSEVNSASGEKGARSKWGETSGNTEKRSERLSAARQKGRHSAEEWAFLVEICGGKCCKCGSTQRICKDHIIPIYQGGSDGIDNLQPLCSSCNSSKGPSNEDLRPSNWTQLLKERLAKTPGERLARTHDIPSQAKPSQIEELHTHNARAREAPDKPDDPTRSSWAAIRSAYPKFAGRADWIMAEHHYRLRLDRGCTPDELLDAVKRYRAYVDGGGASSTAFVLTPAKFFSAPDEPWAQQWPLPTQIPRAPPKSSWRPPDDDPPPQEAGHA